MQAEQFALACLVAYLYFSSCPHHRAMRVRDNVTDWDAIRETHKWCANMRKGSPSMTTTSVPVKDAQGGNPRWFAVSVCCATCLCHFWEPQKSDRFYYAQDASGAYGLWRRPPGGGEAEMVQHLQPPSDTQAESEAVQSAHEDSYLTFLSNDKVDGICTLMA